LIKGKMIVKFTGSASRMHARTSSCRIGSGVRRRVEQRGEEGSRLTGGIRLARFEHSHRRDGERGGSYSLGRASRFEGDRKGQRTLKPNSSLFFE
jgi:hypothetical protein